MMTIMEFEERISWLEIDAPLANNKYHNDDEGDNDNKDGWDDNDNDDDNGVWGENAMNRERRITC